MQCVLSFCKKKVKVKFAFNFLSKKIQCCVISLKRSDSLYSILYRFHKIADYYGYCYKIGTKKSKLIAKKHYTLALSYNIIFKTYATYHKIRTFMRISKGVFPVRDHFAVFIYAANVCVIELNN